MEVSSYLLSVFGVAFASRIVALRSFFIDAKSFLVGTLFNNLRRPFSMRGVL